MTLDAATPVRSGEELDLARLAPYLLEVLGAPAEAAVTVAQFPGGHSNLTYLVSVGDRELVLRRPPFGSKVKTAHDMGREVRVLSKLAPVWPRAPRPIAYCEDEAVLGAKFYVMERVPGIILRRAPPKDVALTPEIMRRLSESFIDALADLHAVDYRAVGLEGFGKPDGYVERQVSGWTERYRGSQTDDLPAVETLAAWLAANRPASPPATILHNDYKYDNLVLSPTDLTDIRGVLDWEMSTVGDPLMDVGTALCYWVEAGDPDDVKAFAFGPTALPGSATRDELVRRYAERTGRDVSKILFYYAFGLFKTAVVAQQIYYRYKQGLTRDERFAAFLFAVKALTGQALRQI